MRATPYFIGIDGGGTGTSLALVEYVDSAQQPRLVARTKVGSSNYQNNGVEAVRTTLQGGIELLLRAAQVTVPDISGIGAGLAGVDRPTDIALMSSVFATIAPDIPLMLDNDAVPMLYAGTGRLEGIVTICGTGMIALGCTASKRARCGGWGHYTDRGSGYHIARDVIQAVSDAHDGIGAPTALSAAVLERLNVRSFEELIDWIYAPNRRVQDVAVLAEIAATLAESDTIADGIIARAADVLADSALMVARKLGFGAVIFSIIVSGSLLKHSALLRSRFTARVHAHQAQALVILPEYDAAFGAALMAIDQAGLRVPPPPIIESVSANTAGKRNNR